MAPLGRYVLIFGGFAAAVGLTLYPIFLYPMSHLGDYKKTQSMNRTGIIQEDVQPPGSPQLMTTVEPNISVVNEIFVKIKSMV